MNKPYGPSVRVVAKPGPQKSCDLHIQVRDTSRISGWATVTVYNDKAQPEANLLAHHEAIATRRKLVEGENVTVA